MSTMLSVNIDNKSICIAEGSFVKGNLTIGKVQQFEMPAGCIKNEAIHDEILFADALQNILRSGGFVSKNIILSVSNKHAFIKELVFPAAKPKETEGMIKSELYQTFNVSKTDIIQYKPVSSIAGNNGEKLTNYRIAALDRDFAEAFYNVIERVKLKPIAMDININAIDKLLSWAGFINTRKKAGEAIILIDFGYSETTVYIVADDQPLFYRQLDYGTGEIQQIVQGEPDYGNEALISEKKISEYILFDGKELLEQYRNNLRPFFYKLNDEIQKTITFFNNRAREITLNHTYLFGPGSEIQGLCEYWSAYLNIPVETVSSIGKANASENPINPLYLNAVGALIRY